jgi:hypothetical protein
LCLIPALFGWRLSVKKHNALAQGNGQGIKPAAGLKNADQTVLDLRVAGIGRSGDFSGIAGSAVRVLG